MDKRAAHSLVAFIVVSLAACGGSDGPTTPRGPTFPSVLGTYSLTFSAIGVVSNGQRLSSVCVGTWVVTSQTGGAFSGNMSLLSPCANAAALNGDVQPDGTIPRVVFSNTIEGPLPAGCSISFGTYSGIFAGGTITVRRRNNATCPGTSIVIDQTLTAVR